MKMRMFSVALLLCGLLPISQSALESQVSTVIRLDTAALEKVLASSLAQTSALDGLVGRTLADAGNAPGLLESLTNDLLNDILGGGPQAGGLLASVLGRGAPGGGLLGVALGGVAPVGGLLRSLTSLLSNVLDARLTEAKPLNVTLRMNDGGLTVGLRVKLGLETKLLRNDLVNLNLDVNILGSTQMIKNPDGSLTAVLKECQTKINIMTRMDSGMSNVLTPALETFLRHLLCQLLEAVLRLLNSLLAALNSTVSNGALGLLQYSLTSSPVVVGEDILMNLNMQLLDQGFAFPAMDPSSIPPRQPGDHSSTLFLPKEALLSLLRLIVEQGNLNVQLTETGAVAWDAAALRSLLPPGAIPDGATLTVSVKTRGEPKLSMDNGELIVDIKLDVDVSAKTASGSVPLFTATVDVKLAGDVAVVGSSVRVQLAVREISANVASSNVGAIDEQLLNNIVGTLVNPIVAIFNDIMKEPLELPKMPNLAYSSGPVSNVGGVIGVDLITGSA